MKREEFNYKNGYTHGGVFHADDVFATALLKMLNPDIQIERGFTPPQDDGETIVYDIGHGKYDHHQQDSEIRDDEERTPYSSVGLIWREFGMNLCVDEKVWEIVDAQLIKDIDYTDNTGVQNPMSFTIKCMNGDNPEKDFESAVDFATKVLSLILKKTTDNFKEEERINYLAESAKGGVLVLDEYMPMGGLGMNAKVGVVVYPSQRGGYNVHCIRHDETAGINNVAFPAELGGAEIDRLKLFDPSLTFVHKGLFIGATTDLKSAVRVAHEIVARSGWTNH